MRFMTQLIYFIPFSPIKIWSWLKRLTFYSSSAEYLCLKLFSLCRKSCGCSHNTSMKYDEPRYECINLRHDRPALQIFNGMKHGDTVVFYMLSVFWWFAKWKGHGIYVVLDPVFNFPRACIVYMENGSQTHC